MAGTKLVKWENDNMIFEQKREETKSVVYSKIPKSRGFPGHRFTESEPLAPAAKPFAKVVEAVVDACAKRAFD